MREQAGTSVLANNRCISNPTRPKNEWELFNLRHSVLCNIIERIFDVLKH